MKLLIILFFVSLIGCNKDLAKDAQNQQMAQMAKQAEKKADVSIKPQQELTINLEQVPLEVDKIVTARGFAPMNPANAIAMESSYVSAAHNAIEYYSSLILPSNVGFQTVGNLMEHHTQNQINVFKITKKEIVNNGFAMVEVVGERSDSVVEKLKSMQFYKVSGEVDGTKGGAMMLLPMAYKKAFSNALVSGIEVFTKATGLKSGLVTVGKILSEDFKSGVVRVELAIAFEAF